MTMEELTIKENAKAYDELINRLEDVKDAIKKQNYGIAMDVLCKPYPEFQITTQSALQKSEDERIRNFISNELACLRAADEKGTVRYNELTEAISWLEKQGEKDEEILILKDQIESLHAAIKAVKETHRIESEKQAGHAKFCESIQVGDKVTRNQDGVLVNLSQLERVAKPAEKYNITGIGSKHAQGKLGEMIKNLKSAWSEEDEETLKDIITSMTNLKDSATSDALRDIYNSKIDWLKSLRPQNAWKPNDEQIEALVSAIDVMIDNRGAGDKNTILLSGLYHELKTL